MTLIGSIGRPRGPNRTRLETNFSALLVAELFGGVDPSRNSNSRRLSLEAGLQLEDTEDVVESARFLKMLS